MAMDPSALAGIGSMPQAPGAGANMGPGMMAGGAPPMPLPPPGRKRRRGGTPKVRHRRTMRKARKRG